VTIVDWDHRHRAMTDFKSVLLVEAAAGTGKTSLMAGRVAMMLAEGVDPSEIAAITFTELSASELARRIRQTVGQLRTGVVPDYMEAALPDGLGATQRASIESAAAHLDDLTATTIHGFCQAIIRSHGVSAGLDPGARIVDAAVAETLFLAELSAWFSRQLSTEGNTEDPVAILAEQLPLQVVELIRELAMLRRKYSQARPLLPKPGVRPDIDFVQAVDDFVRWQSGTEDRWAMAIVRELRTLASSYADSFAAVPDFATLWRLREPSKCRILVAESLELRRYEDAAEVLGAYPGEAGGEIALHHYAAVDRAWCTLIGHIATHLVWSVSGSLDDMIQSYDRRKRDAAVLDFDDLLVHARDLVRDHEAVREAVGLRFKYLLVDEFQDTDRLQAEILFLIAAKQPPSTWHKAQLRPGSLFLVGDPKQAIYRFRGADIETYQLSRALIVSQPRGAVLEITANFRSQRAILDHVNECFQAVFSKPFQPPYVPLSATIAERSYGVGSVTKFTIEIEEKVYADKLREAEAARIAEICERLIGNIIVRRADKSVSPLRAGDIALLSPSHAELWRYERALEARGLAVSSQAGQTLMRRQETQDVLALLRVLADPFDTLAFGALMRGPLVGLTDRELLDITAALSPSGGDHPSFFTVQTDADLVPHPLARAVLKDLQDLRKRAATTSPSLILAEAIEKLAARVIIAARYRNRNARALTNLDALIERARPYGVSGLRAFVRDLQADWEGRTRVSEGRIDATENAVEFVTIHSAKGLEWPVVIPINTTTQLRRPDQFVYRHSDNSLHWMLGGVAPPELAQARAEEGEEEARQRERIWYVACTRARDLLILPSIPQAVRASWFSAVDLGQQRVSEFEPSTLPDNPRGEGEAAANDQTTAVFAAEQEMVAASAPPISWRRPSDHDPDRRGEAAEPVVMVETVGDRIEAIGAGALRGVILHKLMEEILIGELASPDDVPARASALLGRLAAGIAKAILPDPCEMAQTALRTLSLPDIAALRPLLIPELPLWASAEDGLIAGRADALAVRDGSIEVAFDWKSDVHPTPSVRAGYVRQLRDYLSATGASRGAVVFMSLGEVVWVNA
jgi:ATP-dependent exoDNAse (exonuclease V) beta subunit